LPKEKIFVSRPLTPRQVAGNARAVAFRLFSAGIAQAWYEVKRKIAKQGKKKHTPAFSRSMFEY
jgi:hypothetical protein